MLHFCIILESVLEGLDEYYSEELRQKIVRGIYDNALQGKACGGQVPYGLRLSNDKRYIIDEDKSVIVREIFERYVSGEKAVDIVRDLNRRGLRTAKGNEFNKNSIHHILKNPKYYGLMHFKSKDESYDEVYKEGVIPAIVSKDLFLQAQSRLNDNKHRTCRDMTEDEPVIFLLSGKAFDGVCGGALTGDGGTGKSGRRYYYYTCTNRKRKRACKTKPIQKELLEDIVIEVTKDKILVPDTIEFITDCVIQLQEKKLDSGMLNSMESELRRVQSGLKNIVDAIECGVVTDTTQSRILELELRQAKLESQIKIERKRLRTPKLLRERVLYFLEKLGSGEANDEIYRKHLIDLFVQGVIVNPDTITIAYRYTGENDIIDVDFNVPETGKPKDSSESVRLSLINWRRWDSNPRCRLLHTTP